MAITVTITVTIYHYKKVWLRSVKSF